MDSKNIFEVETKSVQNHNLEQEKSNLDVALEVLGDIDHVEYTPEEEKKLLLKIDLHLMTFMIGSYLLQFLDKNALSNSSVFGLQDAFGRSAIFMGRFHFLFRLPFRSTYCQSLLSVVFYFQICWSMSCNVVHRFGVYSCCS